MTGSNSGFLAAVNYPRGFDIDRLLIEVCAELAKRKLRLGGLLQVSTGSKGNCATAVNVIDLRTGEAFDIWEDRSACARGCRLDERGLAEAAPVLDRAIADRVDLLVMNRFGRSESLGGGLLGCFANAVSANIPVLTAVREPYCRAWAEFHGGLGVDVECEAGVILSWASTSVGPREIRVGASL